MVDDSRDRLLQVTAVMLFFPYLAVPVGSNSNLPFASLLSCLWILRNARGLPSLAATVLTLFSIAPLVSTAFHSVLRDGGSLEGLTGSVAFMAWTLPAFVGATAIGAPRPRADLRVGVSIGLLISSGMTVAQFIAIKFGVLPFQGFYSMPGYPPVRAMAESIVRYSQRPFGWFPETSFMAGTVVLGVAVLLVIRILDPGGRAPWFTIILALGAIVLSGSGVIVFGLVLIVPLLPIAYTRRNAMMALPILAISAVLAQRTLERRRIDSDWSWGDRYASLAAAVRYWWDSDESVAIGLGRDAVGRLYRDRDISMAGFDYEYYPRGVYSIAGKLVTEGGLIFGLLPLLFVVAVLAACAIGTVGLLRGTAFSCLVIAVMALVTGYETASMVWLALGAGMGLREGSNGARGSSDKRRGDRWGSDVSGAAGVAR